MISTSSNTLILRTPHFAASSSSEVSSSSSSSSSLDSYTGKHWNHPVKELQDIIEFLGIKDQTVAGQVCKTWRANILYTWDISTRKHRFSWREANLHPRLNYLLTDALMDIVSQMREERGQNYGNIALALKRKYQYLMNIIPSFRRYAMMRLDPHLGPKIVQSYVEFNETIAAEKIIYDNSKDLTWTSDVLLYVLMEIEKNSSFHPETPLTSEKSNELFNLVLRMIDNGDTCASLLMAQKPHVWPPKMLEQMAIASLKKEDYRALEMTIRSYSVAELQRLQSENPRLVLPPVLHRLALQEEDLSKRDIALEAAFEAYKTYSSRPLSHKILCDLASTKFDLGRHTEAVNLINKKKRLTEAKASIFILSKLADFKFRLQEYEDANSLFIEIIKKAENNIPAITWYRSAYTKQKLKQYEEAYQHYKFAIIEYANENKTGAPAHVFAYAAYTLLDLTNQNEARDSQIDYNEADLLFTEAIKKYGDAIPVLVLSSAADLKLELERYGEADALYSQIIAKFGDKIEIEDLNGAALAKLMLREDRDAVRLYTQVIQAFKELKSEVPADILANIARANLRLKRYEDAVKFYKLAIEKFGDEVPAAILQYAAEAEFKLKELQKASVKGAS